MATIDVKELHRLINTNKRIAEALRSIMDNINIASTSADVPITLDGEAVVLGAGTAEVGKVKISDGTEQASVNASNQLEVAEANSTAIKTAVEIIDNPVSGNEMLIAGGATQTNDVKVTHDGEVVSVDATGQGDVPVTLDGEVVTETNSASIKTAVEIIDNAVSGNEMLIAGGATQANDVKITLDGEVPEVQGDAAEDAAVSGNPILIGGRYDATARSLDNGDVGAIALYKDGAQIVKDFGLEVALGRVPGYGKVNKFGTTTDADNGVATDVWDGADGTTSTDVWVAPTQARTHTIASTDADDTDGGAGMRTVRIYGLQTWSSAESSEDVTLNTGSPPVTSNSYVIIHRMVGLTFGATGSNEGIVTATATTDGTVTAAILAGEGQTNMAIYGVPDTQTLQMTYLEGMVVEKPAGVKVNGELLVKENADQSDSAFIHKQHFYFSDTLPYKREFKIPKSFSGPCIVKVQVNTDTNDSTVTANFDGYVVDN